MSKDVRNVVVKSRNKALIDFAYNINKICFIPELKDDYTYNVHNKIRVISHILSNNFKTAYYITESDIKEYSLRLKDNQFGMIYEYLKVVDDETGKKEYSFMIKYNLEQFIDEDKEKMMNVVEERLKEDKVVKHNLKRSNIEKFFKENKYDDLSRIIFIAFLNLEKGKKLEFFYRYDEEMKKVLIEYIEKFEDEIKNIFFKVNIDLQKFLEESEVKNEENNN